MIRLSHVPLCCLFVQIAFTALRVLSRRGEKSKAIKILRASLVGDSQVCIRVDALGMVHMACFDR